MLVLYFVLYLLALLCFVAAAFTMDAPAGRRGINLVALGLGFVALVWVIQSAQAAF